MQIDKHTLGIAPLSQMAGLKAPEAVVLCWIWNLALWGDEWTYADLGRLAKTTAAAKICETLAKAGKLVVVPEQDRKNSKPSCMYKVAHAQTEQPLPQPSGKLKAEYAPWVYDACRIWGKLKGTVGPQQMHVALKMAMTLRPHAAVLTSMENCLKSDDARFVTTPRKFAESYLVRYLPAKKTDKYTSSLGSLLTGGGTQH